MLKSKSKKLLSISGILTWMVINTIFVILELTVFNDAAD